MPKMGAPCGFGNRRPVDFVAGSVNDFENWLIFYHAKRDGVEIVHVMHGARDDLKAC